VIPDLAQPIRQQRDAAFRLGLACNQHCIHCDRHTTRRDPELPALPRLQALVAAGVRHVTLGGGEPTLSPQLLGALGFLRDHAVTVTLETNGLVLAQPQARARLLDLDVRQYTVHFPGLDPATYGAITRDPDGHSAALQAIRALLGSGAQVGVSLPILRTNLAQLPDLAEFLTRELPGVHRVVLHTYQAQGPMAPQDLHPHPREWQTALLQARTGLQAAGIKLHLPHGTGLPACLLQAPETVPFLVARTASPPTLPEACQGCTLRDACPGPPAGLLDAFADLQLRPVLRRGVRRAVESLHSRSQPEANYVRDIVAATPRGPVVRELLLRIVQQCNERCSFCWVDFEAPPAPEEQLWNALESLTSHTPRPIVSFTGGEPTLHPQLEAFVRRARDLGATQIQLQTNATRCDGDRSIRLRDAGLTHALVGFHAHTAALYGQVTGTPALFEPAVAGVCALLAAGVDVHVNHVLNRENAPFAQEFVQFAHDRLVGGNGSRPLLVFAVAADLAGGALRPEVLPRLSELAEPLRRALDLCLAQGIPFAGVTHPCGVPPCLLGGDPRYVHDAARWRFEGDPDGQGPGPSSTSGKIPGCSECIYDRFCPGLRPEYAAVHGTGELRPVRILPRFAVLGLGRMGQRQAAWFATLPEAEVLAFTRRSQDPQLLQWTVQVTGARLLPRDLPDLAGAALVTLCDETAAHLPTGLALLESLAHLPAPRPLLLIEKPLATTALQARELQEASDRLGIRLLVHHTQVADPALVALRHVVAAGTLGALQAVHLTRHEPQRVHADDVDATLPVLHDHLVHEWSLVDTLARAAELEPSEPTQVTATIALIPQGFTADLTMHLGPLAVTIAARIGPKEVFQRTLTVTGTRAQAILRHGPGLRELWVDGTRLPLEPTDGLAAALMHVTDLALDPIGPDPQPWLTAALSAQAGVRVLQAVEALLARLTA
jgi:MoaA/NifB/PqqE/SkfB family radical SAM enzyme/predicted dehydrogenase